MGVGAGAGAGADAIDVVVAPTLAGRVNPAPGRTASLAPSITAGAACRTD